MSDDRKSIAIVGMAFRFPGDLSDSEHFWEALKSGEDLISTVPKDRWAKDTYYHSRRNEPGRSYTWSAGVLS
ncbi:MAG: hypothetical protein GY703_00445, partial [Gammaproteobacteria bacterium]|nr:hypothetical protein [Gammaproteobacteria bacterium]